MFEWKAEFVSLFVLPIAMMSTITNDYILLQNNNTICEWHLIGIIYVKSWIEMKYDIVWRFKIDCKSWSTTYRCANNANLLWWNETGNGCIERNRLKYVILNISIYNIKLLVSSSLERMIPDCKRPLPIRYHRRYLRRYRSLFEMCVSNETIGHKMKWQSIIIFCLFLSCQRLHKQAFIAIASAWMIGWSWSLYHFANKIMINVVILSQIRSINTTIVHSHQSIFVASKYFKIIITHWNSCF
jgi:hypothetical protein